MEGSTAAPGAIPSPPPSIRLIPIAADSGMPSSNAPMAMAVADPPCASPEFLRRSPPRRGTPRPAAEQTGAASANRGAPAPRARPVAAVQGCGPEQHPGRRRVETPYLVRLVHELEGDGGDEHPGPERHDAGHEPPWGARVEADAPPGEKASPP